MVNNNLQPMILQINKSSRSDLTGGTNDDWEDLKTIQVKLIKIKATTVVNGTRTNMVNYKGITKSTVNKEINRLKDPVTKAIFYIEDSFEALWTNLDLKVVDVF